MKGRKSRPQAGGAVKRTKKKQDDTPIILSSTQPTLYLGIVGTLVLQEGSNFRLAPFAREFVHALRDRFRIVVLTRLSPVAAMEVSALLETEFEFGEYRKGLGKVSGIDFGHPFIWVDDAPTSRDLMRLAEERCSAQLVTVNGKDGVTRSTLNKVESCLEETLLVRD